VAVAYPDWLDPVADPRRPATTKGWIDPIAPKKEMSAWPATRVPENGDQSRQDNLWLNQPRMSDQSTLGGSC
jgi:hypothetical protein